MKKLIALVTLVTTMFYLSAPAWAEIDHWATSGECLTAESGPYYYPTIVHEQPLANDEVEGGLPSPSCVEMNLPDRLDGRGWVRIGEDRKVIFDRETGKPLRLAECNNQIFSVVALPINDLIGEKGDQGPQGPKGDSCSVQQNSDGSKTIYCQDGTTTVVKDGMQGPRGPQGEQGVPGTTPQLNWFQRHPILTTLGGAAIVVGICVAAGWCHGDKVVNVVAGSGPGAIIEPAF